MNDDTTGADTHTLIGAYVLDAVSGTERLLFENHLAGCPTCAQETAELRETTALLAGSTMVEPPAHLRERVLAVVANTRQLPPLTERPPGDRADEPAGPDADTPPPGSVNRPPRRDVWLRRAVTLAAAAGVATAVVLGADVVESNNRMERELQAIEQVNRHNSRVAELLAAPDAKLVRGEVTGGGTGTVVASPAKGQVLFLAQGLPRLPDDRTYQMWLIGADGPRSAGLLTSTDGQTTPVLAGGFTGREAVGLTVEPQGGSPQPTTPAVVVLSLV